MANARAKFGHIFTVSPVDISLNVDTFTNVIKRREQILYRTTCPPQGANIAHVAGDPVTSSANLSIADRSSSLPANRVREGEVTTVTGTKTFTIDTENFVVTDEFTDETKTIVEIPLFYKHILSEDNLARELNGDLVSTISIISIDVLDSQLSPVQTPELKIDLTKGIIYNNLLSEYKSSGDYTHYYVKYIVNDNGTVKTYVDLLDNITTYSLATFDDLTATLQIITDGRKVYLIEEIASGYEVTLPVTGTYAFKATSSSRIEIIRPVIDDTEDPWYVRVTNGKFFTQLSGTLYKYHISEFLNQSFTPEPPIKQTTGTSATILSENLIKLDHDTILENDLFELYVNLLIDDKNGLARAAYTTNSTLAGTLGGNGATWEKWTNSDRAGIRSIDHRIGLVEIEGIELKAGDTVTATYSFEETNYELTLVDFNPISNNEALTTRTALYIDPDESGTSKTQTLFYLKTNEAGKVIESNWDQFNNETQTYAGDSLDVYYEHIPSFLQTTTPGDPNYIDPNTHLFIDEFSVEGSMGGTFLVLGDITVSEAIGTQDVITIDSRVRGGGIAESELETAWDEEPEVAWCWDVGCWDGLPFPGNACYLVEVPLTIMDGAGGIFRSNDIRDIVLRHTAEGVYPVIKSYGVDIDYTEVMGGQSIRLQWQGYNAQPYELLPRDSDPLGHFFMCGNVTKADLLYHAFTVAFPTDVSIGHELDITGISVDSQLGHELEIDQITTDRILRHQFGMTAQEENPLQHNFDVEAITTKLMQEKTFEGGTGSNTVVITLDDECEPGTDLILNCGQIGEWVTGPLSVAGPDSITQTNVTWVRMTEHESGTSTGQEWWWGKVHDELAGGETITLNLPGTNHETIGWVGNYYGIYRDGADPELWNGDWTYKDWNDVVDLSVTSYNSSPTSYTNTLVITSFLSKYFDDIHSTPAWSPGHGEEFTTHCQGLAGSGDLKKLSVYSFHCMEGGSLGHNLTMSFSSFPLTQHDECGHNDLSYRMASSRICIRTSLSTIL